MEHQPSYIAIAFAISTLLCVWLICRASKRPGILLLLSAWLLLQALIAGSGFYADTQALPPRLMLAVLPPFALVTLLFVTPKGKAFTDSLSLPRLSMIHLVRIPVEGVLLALFLHKAVPEGMTFEGNNYDIISGLTAPLALYLARSVRRRKWLLVWNFICLALLLHIVIYAIFAAPFPFQQWDFDQPNVAVLYFPFIWLPSFIVPVVFFAHVSAIRQLLVRSKEQNQSQQMVRTKRQTSAASMLEQM